MPPLLTALRPLSLIAALGCVVPHLTTAAESSRWAVRTWQSDDGLPNNTVTDIAQTTEGYLWIATPAQLARFDGVQFEGFWPKRIIPAYDRKITALLATRAGGLWLGMNHGPLLYLHSGQIQVVTDAVQDLIAASIVEDVAGAVWIDYHGGNHGARGGILYRVKDGRAEAVPSSSGGGDSRSIACDAQGGVWLARDGELSAYRAGHFEPVLALPTRSTRIAAGRNRGLWIATGFELFRYHATAGLEPSGEFASASASVVPTVLLEDSRGAVWIGTADSGLFRCADGAIDRIATSHPQILCLHEDREANVWVGTGGGGLERIEPQTIALEGTEAGLPVGEVRSLCEDAHGRLWATTETGELVSRKGDRWRTATIGAGGLGKSLTCVAAAPDGAIWVGTQQRALLRVGDGPLQLWQRSDGLISRVIYALHASRNGDLWIGGNAPESLQRLRAGHLQTIGLPPTVRLIRALAEDASGTLWAGTSNGLLLRVEGDRAIDESGRLSGANLSIRCLRAADNGRLWIGYAGWGLGRLERGRLTRITSEQGLPDDQISQVVADDRGWLWLGADHGIFKVREQEFDDVAAGRAHRLHPIHYGSSDGLPSLQANFGVSPGARRTRDGRIWLPMVTALAVADPHRVRQDLAPPVVLLKRIVVDDQTVAFYGGAVPVENAVDLRDPRPSVRLPPGHRRLEFDFTALNFAAPENLTFQYRLDGLDEGWIESSTQRSVSYSRLPTGRYVFRVRARNGDGIWSAAGSSIAFTVDPFFWQTWWFRLSALAAFTTLVIAAARYISFRRLRLKLQRLQQQAALDRERARIAKDIHDDVGASLTQVALLNGLVERDRSQPAKVGEHVRQIATAVRSVTDSLDEIVWAVNPRNDTLPHLINYLGKYAVDFLRMAGIRCVPELPAFPPDTALSAEVRHNLFLVAKEALNNVVRHARATEVVLTIACADDALEIAVRDNGAGFDASPETEGADGLRNMQQRMAAIGGGGRIESRRGGGTTVTLTVPLSPAATVPGSIHRGPVP